MPRKLNRRDRIYAMANRASKLIPEQRIYAWDALAIELDTIAEMPAPKFEHLFHAIRAATIKGKQIPP